MPRPPAPIQDIDKIISANLRAFRRFRGMTQSDLAAKTDVSVSMISKIESGTTRIRVDTLDLAAKALGEEHAAFFAPLPQAAE